jgi:hypothetical protein
VIFGVLWLTLKTIDYFDRRRRRVFED